MMISRVILTRDNGISLHAFLQLHVYILPVLLQTGVIRNYLPNPYKTRQTQDSRDSILGLCRSTSVRGKGYPIARDYSSVSDHAKLKQIRCFVFGHNVLVP